MKNNFIAGVIVALLLVSGCARETPDPGEKAPDSAVTPEAPKEEVKPTAPPFTGPRAPAGSELVQVPVADGEPVALRIGAGQTISGSLVSDRAGKLLAFGVRIGNSRGTSNGDLTLKLCQAAACQEVNVPLLGTRDNDYLVFNLTVPLEMAAGQSYDFRLSRSASATNPVAIWTFPAPMGVPTLIDADSNDTGRVAKLALYLEK